jgi:Peptidase A4 family
MLINRLSILGALAILPAVAQVSDAPLVPEGMPQLSRHQHGPIRIKEKHDDGTVTSTNWSAYAVTGSSFTSAKGSWIVPTATCPSGDQYAAFWVGIDGYSSTTVEQTGTDSDCDGKNRPSYYAWYEFYPNPSFTISSLSIKPGDRISAQVVYSGSEFTITITDETSGKSYSKSSTVRGAQRSSAEWIAEAPCCTARGGILPLADFGTVLFGEDSTGVTGTNEATMGGTTGVIGSFANIFAITMESSSGATEAVPSALSSDGSSFSVNWASQ